MFVEKILRSGTLLITWSFAILILSLLPSEGFKVIKIGFAWWMDKAVHLVIYAILSFLLGGFLTTRFKIKPSAITLTTIALSAIFGILMEMFQFWFTSLGRSYEFMDIVFNTIGAVLGYGILLFVKIKTLNHV